MVLNDYSELVEVLLRVTTIDGDFELICSIGY